MTEVNVLATTLLNGIWEGAFLAMAMWLFLKLVPRLNPTTRFTVLWATLLATVVLLLAPFILELIPPGAASPTIAAPDKPSTMVPINIEEQKLSSLNSGTSSPSSARVTPTPDPLPIAASPSPIPARLSPIVESPSAPSQRPSIAMPAQYPFIRIRSGKLLVAFGILWASLSLLMLMRLGFGYWKLRGLKAGATPMASEWERRLRALEETHAVERQTQLLVSSQVRAPMSLGFLHPAILIPQTLLDTLSDAELEHVVLHELGHLRRRDDWTNLAQKLIEGVVPIQPAVYWIGRRMTIEREMACDDWVIAATGAAEPYATSLTRVAELSGWARADMLAAGATGNRSQLFSRVHHMLDRTRNARPKLTLVPLSAAIAALGVLIYLSVRAPQVITFAQELPAARTLKAGQTPNPRPAPSIEVASLGRTTVEGRAELTASSVPPQAPGQREAEAQRGESHVEMTTQNGTTSLSVKIKGAIEFTDDDHDIKSLAPGGHFRMEEVTALSRRTYEVKADSAGNLTKTYSVDSSVRPMDTEGREWLAHLLPQVIRDSGVGAGPRVARMLRQGGPEAVLSEIRLIHSDGSKRIYLEELFSQAKLNPGQLKAAAQLIRGISSDGDKAQVLIDVDQHYFSSELRQNLFDAAESISSDGDKRRVLSDILKKDAGSEETLLDVARAAKHISSDGDKAEVLIEMASAYRTQGELATAYLEAVKSISSDGDHARVLLALLASHGDDRETLVRVLTSAGKISSDGDKARVLKEAVARYGNGGTISKAFIDAANSISSDGDHQQVLVALIQRQGIDAATADEIARSAQRISSDGDKALVLVELLQVNVEPVRDGFFAATDSISSDGDHSRVLMALLDKPGTSPTMAVAAIQSATRMSSDGDKSRVLLDAAHRYSSDPQVDQALRKAVESLHSDGEYRSVMSQLSRPKQSK